MTNVKTFYPATLLCDAYKISHKAQYPVGTEKIYSTWTPRVSRIEGINEVVAFGFQAFVNEYLVDYFQRHFFDRSVEEVCDEYTRVLKYTLGISDPDSSHIAALHKLGYLPLRIKAVPEGTLVPIRTPMLTVENTLPEFFWLTNYIETLMSLSLWKPSTNATIAREYRKILDLYAELTGGPKDFVQFQGHDFSMRGMDRVEAAALSGAGHLLSFSGTDTIPAITFLEKNYGADITKELVGTSIPASEHSVMCAYGQDELAAYKELITKVYPSGFVSIVSDTWDLWSVLTKVIATLKPEILAREGKVVIRPDCYDAKTQILTNSGWRLFKDLTTEDLVAQVLEDGTFEFVKPLKYVEQDYEGEMVHFYDGKGKMDLLLTPNHRMIYTKNGINKVKEASSFPHSLSWKTDFKRSALKRGATTHLSYLERLKIAFQADGSYQTGTDKIRFSFSKKRKMNRLEYLLNSADISFKKYGLKDERFEYSIDISAEDFSKDLYWVDLESLNANWCKEFIEELSYWDACRRSSERFKFDTTNKAVVDVVELIALYAGFGCLISEYEDNRSDIFSNVYTAHILKSNILGGQSVETKSVRYKGKIYCVQVPSGKLIVKRNRATLVCGNSGDPVDIICGDPSSPDERVAKGVIEILWDIFGGSINAKGFKELDPHIGAIYGDAITIDRCRSICEKLAAKGFASTNMVFGIGSYTYQYNTRDTLGFALKSTYARINGIEKFLFKDPVTDIGGVKKSQTGMVVVNKDRTFTDGLTEEQRSAAEYDLLRDIFLNGKVSNTQTLAEIRERLSK